MARPTVSLQAAIGPGSAVTNLFTIGVSLIGGTDVIGGREIYGQGGWQEIADRAYTISTRRGRQRQLEQYKAGTLTAEIDNVDGALDPAWLGGPYTDVDGTTTTIASDDFNRANSAVTLGSTPAGVAWVPLLGTWGITGNTAYKAVASASFQDLAVVDVPGSADATISVTIGGVGYGGPAWRVIDSVNQFFWQGTNGAVYRQTGAGAFTLMAAPPVAVAGDTLTVVTSGALHTLYKNGVNVGSFTDAQGQTSTRHGLYEYLTTGTFDNFTVAIPHRATRVKAMAGVSVRANWAGVDYDIYNGYADGWKPSLSYPEGGRTSLAATDAFKIFTKINPLAQSFAGAGETSGARMNRILDLANWSATLRDIDTGEATHQSTNLAQPIATQLRLTGDSERGDLYINGAGKVTFRGQQSRYQSGRSRVSQAAIGDGVTDWNPARFNPSNDDDILYNDVNVARAGGTVITRTDPTVAAAPYLRSTYTRNDLTLADDGQVATYADNVLRVNKAIQYRIDSITFEPDGYDNLWPLILGTQFGDRITVGITHPRTGVRFSGDYFVEGIDHDIPVLEVGGKWVTTFHLSSAVGYPANPFIIGTSLIGGTDVIV